jgi:bifunctional N-acetylglucosamine-1-phosphate-uridyltransferase/glucosamine-1-phosphate-acetyltransferase GlmU-like protein
MNMIESKTCGIVLAAGRSSRMAGSANKLTTYIGSHPMVYYPVHNLIDVVGVEDVFVVIGHDREAIKHCIGERVRYVEQDDQKGTGDAARLVIPHLDPYSTVIVLFGDCPFLDENIIRLTLRHHESNDADLTFACARMRDALEKGHVIITTEGTIERIVDGATEPLTPTGAEIFAGLSVWRSAAFRALLPQLEPTTMHDGRREWCLPDAAKLAVTHGMKVVPYGGIEEGDAIAPNRSDEFELADRQIQIKKRQSLQASGVVIQDPTTVQIDYDVQVEQGTTILHGARLYGKTRIGKDCFIGPGAELRDCDVGNGARVGRGTWERQAFPAGSRVADRMSSSHQYFRTPHFLLQEEQDLCFGILPFSHPYLDLFSNIVRPAVERSGYRYETADRPVIGNIIEQIWEGINRASIVIAEVSEDNSNVWFECGLAHALNKPVVMLSKQGRKLPFDISGSRVLIYDGAVGDLGRKLDEMLRTLQKPRA